MRRHPRSVARARRIVLHGPVGGLAALSVAAFFGLLWRTAPYGRFARPGWGRTVSPRLAWLLMESPAAILFTLMFLAGTHVGIVPLVFLVAWNTRLRVRGFVYPWLKRSDRGVPISIIVAALGFHAVNVYLQTRYLFHLVPPYPAAWLADPRFLAGVALWAVGFRSRCSRTCFCAVSAARPPRIPHPPRRSVPLGLLSQLPRRVAGVVRLGAADVVAAGAGLRRVDGGEPRSSGDGLSPMVSRAVSRLPGASQGRHPGAALARPAWVLDEPAQKKTETNGAVRLRFWVRSAYRTVGVRRGQFVRR